MQLSQLSQRRQRSQSDSLNKIQVELYFNSLIFFLSIEKENMSDSLFSFVVSYTPNETDAELNFLQPLSLRNFVPNDLDVDLNNFYKLLTNSQVLKKTATNVYSNSFGDYTPIATFSRDPSSQVTPNLNILSKSKGTLFNLSGKSNMGSYSPSPAPKYSLLYEYSFRENDLIVPDGDNFTWKVDTIEVFVKGDNEDSAILYRGNDYVKNFTLPANIEKVLETHTVEFIQEFNSLRRDASGYSKINKLSPTYEINGLSVSLNISYDLQKDQIVLESYYVFVPTLFSSMCRGGFTTTSAFYSEKDQGYVLDLPMVPNQLTNFRVHDSTGKYHHEGYVLFVEVDNTPKTFLYQQSGTLATPTIKTTLGTRFKSGKVSLIFDRPAGLSESSLNVRSKEVRVIADIFETQNIIDGKLKTDKYASLEGLTLAYVKATCQSFDCTGKTWSGYLLFSKSNYPNVVVQMIQTKGQGLDLVPGSDQKSTFIRFKDSKSNTYYPNVQVEIASCTLIN